MAKKTVHVEPNSNGWRVKKNGTSRASVTTSTKAEAVKIGRIISQRSGGAMVVHGKDEKISKKD
jgi:hypothetical protein